MAAVLAPRAQQEIEFALDALVTLDLPATTEREFVAKMKARYYFESNGDVCVCSVWVNDVHDRQYGGLPYWKAFHFPRSIVRQIEHAIEDHYGKKQ
jgi:hypothetical protein